MKRGAEKQLTKDGDDEIDESEARSGEGQGFKKASESAMAGRSIKPLPTRGSGRAGVPQPAPPTNTFNPFTAGGSSTFAAPIFPSTTPTFASFGPPKTSTSETNSSSGAPATSAFNQSATSSTSSIFSKFTIPPLSSTAAAPPAATTTSKAFASLLNSPSTNIFGNPSSSSQPSIPLSTTSKPINGSGESTLTKYYTNLRALNASLQTYISSTVEKDPFSDMTGLLESYKAMRLKVQKEYDDEAPEKGNSKPDASGSSKPAMPSMPTPPPSFSGFGPFKSAPPPPPSSSDSKPPSSMFGSSPTFSPFSPPKATTAPSTSSTPPAPTNPFSPPASGLSFGNSSSAPSTTSSPFGSSSSSSPSFTFTAGASQPTLAGDKPPSSLFGFSASQQPGGSSSLFGSSSTTVAPEKPSTTPSNPFGAPATSVFGSGSSLPFSFGSSASSPQKPDPGIGFGTPSSVAMGSGLYHGFGSNSSTSTADHSPAAPAVATTSDAGSQKEPTTEDNASDKATSTADGGIESKEATPGLLTPNPHDEEGVGEENEETLHAVKLKAYRMKKADEKGGPGWAELGLGVLRLKKDKDTGSRRVLLRNSTNGKININFKVYSSLKPSLAKKALTFVGHDNGASQTYCVRLQTDTQAGDLKAALDREIEFVRAKEGS